MRSPLEELAEFGQSLWLDNISRSLITKGKLKEWIGLGLRGLTSNPTIFDKAISSSNDYDKKIIQLKNQGKSTFQIYDYLSIADVTEALDIFRPVYEESAGWDGFVSLEIDPRLANDVKSSIREAKRLFEYIKRPNLMIKIPATEAGFVIIEKLLLAGINVNATLIFSRYQYERVARVYIEAMKQLLQDMPQLVSKVRSVASIFVSRIDTAVDKEIEQRLAKKIKAGEETEGEIFQSLLGKAAVSNCRLLFGRYLDIFSSSDFQRLRRKGVNIQRIVWASTSTKNAFYSDIKYIEELISKSSINTVPENTLQAFMENGVVKEALTSDLADAPENLRQLKEIGIDIDAVCLKLLQDGVLAFENSFQSLLNSIEAKTQSLCLRR